MNNYILGNCENRINTLFFDKWDGFVNFEKEVDFILFDSLDFHYGFMEASRQHALREFIAIENRMKNNSYVVVDDCDVRMWFDRELDWFNRQGKSLYLDKYLTCKGCEKLFDGYQRIYKIQVS